MKEDILEQLVEDYYTRRPGFFTKHNLKFRPCDTDHGYNAKFDCVHSDIDILAIETTKRFNVYAISCKAWQGGFDIKKYWKAIESAIASQPQKEPGQRDLWCSFRELCIEKWTSSFVRLLRTELNVTDLDKAINLEYIIVCTKITSRSLSEKDSFENSSLIKDYFRKHIVNLNLKILTIDSFVADTVQSIQGKSTPAVETTHLSRTLQLLLAAGYKFEK